MSDIASASDNLPLHDEPDFAFIPNSIITVQRHGSTGLFDNLPLELMVVSPTLAPTFTRPRPNGASLAGTPHYASELGTLTVSTLVSIPLVPGGPHLVSPGSVDYYTDIHTVLLKVTGPVPALPPPNTEVTILVPVGSPLEFGDTPPRLPQLVRTSI